MDWDNPKTSLYVSFSHETACAFQCGNSAVGSCIQHGRQVAVDKVIYRATSGKQQMMNWSKF